MRIVIDNYRNLTAEHCGSGSMRNLVYHYCQLELPEGVIFGLGSGLDCLFFDIPEATPPFMLFGRSITMEQDLAAALGLDYQELPEPDNEQAWQQVRQQVIDGKPTMLSGDIYYLDYRKFKVHFPGHRFVLLGFDDAKREVYIADRTESATQACSMDALRLSRNPPVGISTANLWGTFNSSRVANSLPDACALALHKTTQRMLGADSSQLDWIKLATPGEPDWLAGGLAGIELLGQQLQQWPSDSAAPEYAAYMVNAITKFGTGGALFRNLFREFIEWSHLQRPDLVSADCVRVAQHSALHWTCLSDTMQQLSNDSSQTAHWSDARKHLADAQLAETELFERLAENVPLKLPGYITPSQSIGYTNASAGPSSSTAGGGHESTWCPSNLPEKFRTLQHVAQDVAAELLRGFSLPNLRTDTIGRHRCLSALHPKGG